LVVDVAVIGGCCLSKVTLSGFSQAIISLLGISLGTLPSTSKDESLIALLKKVDQEIDTLLMT
jgi:hypothetical protein